MNADRMHLTLALHVALDLGLYVPAIIATAALECLDAGSELHDEHVAFVLASVYGYDPRRVTA